MRMLWTATRVCSSLVFVLAIAGCRSKPATIVRAAGRVVTSDGKPIKSVRVDFWPEKKPKSFETLPYGLTNEKGEFEIVMLDPSKPGLWPGKYRVSLIEIGTKNPKRIPSRYGDNQSTPLEVTIPVEGKTDLILEVRD